MQLLFSFESLCNFFLCSIVSEFSGYSRQKFYSDFRSNSLIWIRISAIREFNKLAMIDEKRQICFRPPRDWLMINLSMSLNIEITVFKDKHFSYDSHLNAYAFIPLYCCEQPVPIMKTRNKCYRVKFVTVFYFNIIISIEIKILIHFLFSNSKILSNIEFYNVIRRV